jgi:hypothetical protein
MIPFISNLLVQVACPMPGWNVHPQKYAPLTWKALKRCQRDVRAVARNVAMIAVERRSNVGRSLERCAEAGVAAVRIGAALACGRSAG